MIVCDKLKKTQFLSCTYLNSTRIRFLPRVYPRVILKIRRTRKRLTTIGKPAHIRSFPRMRPNMHFFNIRRRERPSTACYGAFEGFLAGVRSHVFLQITGGFEVFVAGFATVRFFPGVGACVRFQ